MADGTSRAERRPRRRRRRRKAAAAHAPESGDTFLLHASVMIVAAAALAWTMFQVVLYGGSEPAMVVIPFMYPVVVFSVSSYERFRCVSPPPRASARRPGAPRSAPIPRGI